MAFQCINYLERVGDNAEKVFRFLSGDMEFEECHTAIEDCLIESEIFAKVVKKMLSAIKRTKKVEL